MHMSDTNKTEQYVEYINENILPLIDYEKLQASYNTDMVYAKGILHSLHKAMIAVYGGDGLDVSDGGEDGFVVVPGILRGKDSGKLCLALFDLDLSSSGEHWGTAFLCEHGVVSQNSMKDNLAAKETVKAIGPYDYCYTAAIPGDIHVSKTWLPKELKAVLKDFRNHSVDLRRKVSVKDRIREAAKTPKEPPKDKPTRDKDRNGPEL